MFKYITKLAPAAVGATLVFAWAALHAGINPPLGPHVNLKESDFEESASFTSEDLLVGTYYFYWYDIWSNTHILNPDGSDALTTHPPTLTGFSYKSRQWHRRQLEDMMEAGIDFMLPVYWGAPSEQTPGTQMYWSFEGLGPLVSARDELIEAGREPPSIGLFYDTSTLQYNTAGRHIDLTTDYGRDWFYESIRDFFSVIPPRHWAMIDGRPIIFLYSAAFAVNHDQSSIDFVKESFARDFGGRVPYIVRELSWNVEADDTYAWGGALGLRNPGVAALGPGYDHSAVPGREPLIVDREDGEFFKRHWLRFLRNPSNIVMIETWNEFHEGTDIAESLEYGRQYIELNREFVGRFKAGERPEWPRGPYSDRRLVRVVLKAENAEEGLRQLEHADGVTAAAVVGDSPCRGIVATEHGGRYIYLRIDDSFKWANVMEAECEIEYFDAAPGSFRIEYDGSDPGAPFQGAYTGSASVTLTGNGAWKTARINLPGARFLNSQNGGADLRIAVSAEQFYVREVRVIRPGVPEEAGQRVRGFQEAFAPGWDENWTGSPHASWRGGILSVRSAEAPPNRLLAWPDPAPASTQEVLARLRVVSHSGSGVAGGVSVAMNPDQTRGFDFHFRISAAGGRSVGFYDETLGWGPHATFSWQTNTWYWLRVRHQISPAVGHADLLAKVWPADGLAREPPHWLVGWNYYPSAPGRSGAPGIVPGWGEIAAEMQFDYFLVQSEPLPEIEAALSPTKPGFFGLVMRRGVSGTELVFNGELGRRYVLEVSTNLLSWKEADRLVLRTSMQQTLSFSPAGTQRFFRTRLLP